MSLLGKILLFINLLAAGGLFYLATQTWGKRQEISGVVLRYRLALAGLPVEKPKETPAADSTSVPVEIPNGDGTYTDYVARKLLDDYFQGSGSGTPLSQIEEIEKAKQSIDANITGKSDAEVLRYLCGGINPQGRFDIGLLGTYAESFEERAKVREWALARGQAIAAARQAAVQHLNRKFEAVTSPPNPQALASEAAEIDKLKAELEANPNKASALQAFQDRLALGFSFCKDDNERRRRIAHLLMLINADASNQKRVMLVCGLRTYTQAVGEQTVRLEEIIRRTERGFELDQAEFEEKYDTLKRLAIDQDALLIEQRRVTTGLKTQLASDQAALAQRETQLMTIKSELAQLQSTVADSLKRQAEAEKALFEVQKQVGATLQGNFELEEKLRKTELQASK